MPFAPRAQSVLLFSFILHTALASQCPIKEVVIPKPGGCWKCDDNPGFHTSYAADGKPFQVVESWTDFYCKYTKADYLSDGTRANDIAVHCYYDGNGSLTKRVPSSQPCPTKAIRIDGCQDVKKPDGHKGDYEVCCGQGCKTETARCFHCPKVGGTTWVEIDASGKDLECSYHTEFETREQLNTCYFNADTGVIIPISYEQICKDANRIAPQNAECLKAHPEAKDPPKVVPKTCPEGVTPEQCAAEQKQSDFLHCTNGSTDSCPAGSTWCSDGCSTDACWTCPVIPNETTKSDFVQVLKSPQSSGQIQCRYEHYEGDTLGRGGDFCTYDGTTGTLSHGYAKYSTGGCLPQAVKNLKCERLKKAANKRSL